MSAFDLAGKCSCREMYVPVLTAQCEAEDVDKDGFATAETLYLIVIFCIA